MNCSASCVRQVRNRNERKTGCCAVIQAGVRNSNGRNRGVPQPVKNGTGPAGQVRGYRVENVAISVQLSSEFGLESVRHYTRSGEFGRKLVHKSQ
jgi:hypothetical protein